MTDTEEASRVLEARNASVIPLTPDEDATSDEACRPADPRHESDTNREKWTLDVTTCRR